MEWITEIEKMERARFVTKLDPINNVFNIYGQYRNKRNNTWIDFVHKVVDFKSDTKLQTFGEILGDMSKELKEKIANYELIDKNMREMKWIQIID